VATGIPAFKKADSFGFEFRSVGFNMNTQ